MSWYSAHFYPMCILPPFFALVFCGLVLAACDSHEKPVPAPDKTDELVVITVNSPDTYYENSDGSYAGLEFDLVTEFANELGVEVKFKVMPRLSQALLALENPQGHFAAGLNVTDKHGSGARFGPVYQRTQPQVAYNTDYPKPRNIQDLAGGSIKIATGTSHAERLNEARQQVPGLKWSEVDIPAEELLAKLAEGKIDYAIADSTQINLAKNFYPNLRTAFNLGEETGKAWAFSPNADPQLLEKAQKFFKRIEQDGTLKRLLDRYYGHIQRLDQMDVGGILEKMRTTLPDLRDHFHHAEELTGIDWRLIAALAYKESHWDRLATSFTNVRGIMMLTESTADRMKVTDRLDARQSILAGARYLLLLKEMLPPRIAEPDRTWIALAAYNLGYGHVEDARILAQRLGSSPDSWVDLKKILPLLSRSEYFVNLKHGYARGGEAVILTESVRTYHDILLRYERAYSRNFAATEAMGPLHRSRN
ncbi:MAG: membrane-bound lytic murein transglycosylase MltF [Nitrosomonadaceae bacterium]|nr:MAG: membrane-bound lytic murein transglycosylase MltF [Nitrosomonadaceae bacterium]